MTCRNLSFSAALLAGLLFGSASAQSISSVTSSNDATVDATVSASVGSVLTIDGTAFGTVKGKVFLTDSSNKKYNLKLKPTDWTDTVITATIVKAVAGDLTLNVLPKGATVPVTSPVTIEAPSITDLQDAAMQGSVTSVSANDEFVVVGNFFGTKKGKIHIGAKSAKVLSWADDMIHVVMPKTLANGVWPISLDNKLAIDSDNNVETINSLAKLGSLDLNLTVDGNAVSLKIGGAIKIDIPDTTGFPVAIVATSGGTSPKILVLAVPYVVGGDLPQTFTWPGDVIIGEYIDVGHPTLQNPLGGTKIYTGFTDGFSITISADSGGQVAGSFHGTMNSVIPGVDPVLLDGTFVIDLNNN